MSEKNLKIRSLLYDYGHINDILVCIEDASNNEVSEAFKREMTRLKDKVILNKEECLNLIKEFLREHPEVDLNKEIEMLKEDNRAKENIDQILDLKIDILAKT